MASTVQEALPLAVKGKGVTKNSSPEEPEWKSLHRSTTGDSVQVRFTYEHSLTHIRMYT